MCQAPSVRVPGAVIIASNATMDEATGLSWDFSQTMLDRQRQAFGLAKEFTNKAYMGPSSFDIGLPDLHDENLRAFGRPDGVGSVAELGNPGSSLEVIASTGDTNHKSISRAIAMGGHMEFVEPKEVL